MDEQKIVVNTTTGEISTAPLTAEEQAAYDAAQKAASAAILVQQQAAADDLTTRNTVTTLVQSCVGVTWQNLTTAQKQALIVTLLYRAGALDKTLTVQPLAGWLTR